MDAGTRIKREGRKGLIACGSASDYDILRILVTRSGLAISPPECILTDGRCTATLVAQPDVGPDGDASGGDGVQ